MLVEVPTSCSLRAEDVRWAFSGLELSPQTSESQGIVLTPTADDSMLTHYGVGQGEGYFRWRTVTPAALPEEAARRRIGPARRLEEAKSGKERREEIERAASAVHQALRHADIRAKVAEVHLQREPFEANGERVEAFATGTRFAKERLWHVEVTFSEPITGPLIVGDGRFLGLGLMAPVQGVPGPFET